MCQGGSAAVKAKPVNISWKDSQSLFKNIFASENHCAFIQDHAITGRHAAWGSTPTRRVYRSALPILVSRCKERYGDHIFSALPATYLVTLRPMEKQFRSVHLVVEQTNLPISISMLIWACSEVLIDNKRLYFVMFIKKKDNSHPTEGSAVHAKSGGLWIDVPFL